MPDLPAARKPKLLKSRVLRMSVNPKSGEVDVLLRISPTDIDDRNAIHQAMKHGLDLALAYLVPDDGPVIEADAEE